MRKLALLAILLVILVATTVKLPEINTTGINITGLFIGVASAFINVVRYIVKEILLTIANML